MRFHLHTWKDHGLSTSALPVRYCTRCGRVEYYINLRARWEHDPKLESNEMDTKPHE
jgi:hypothetical protein